jgi:hypothetical protein
MPPSRGRQNQAKNQKATNQKQRHRRSKICGIDGLSDLPRAVALLVTGGLGVVGSLWTILGPLWPVAPEIHPTGCDATSPFLLPFSIKNPSALFSMANVKLVCNAYDLRDGANNSFGHLEITTELGSRVAPGQVINTACSVNAPPKFITLKSQRVGVIYDGMFRSQKTYTSPIYNFVKTSTGCQWVEGNIFR